MSDTDTAPAADTAPATDTPSVIESVAAAATNFCASCGAPVQAGAVFCVSCGLPIRAPLSAGVPPQRDAVRSERRDEPASAGRRLSACLIDLALLHLGFMLVLAVGLELVDAFSWVSAGWALIFAPLYFALYHAFGGPERGPGATPGQHELGVVVRDAATGERLSLIAAVVRSYLGLASLALIVPAIVEAVQTTGAGGITWRDRLTHSEVRLVPGSGRAALELPPTAPEVATLFAPGAGRVGRSAQLMRHPALVRSTLAAYLGLVLLAGLLVPLTVADVHRNTTQAVTTWIAMAGTIFASGVYWTQATIVAAVESIRIGERGVSGWEIVRRASRRANALSVVLVLLIAALYPWAVLVVPLILLPRLALTVPAIVLEDRSVFGAFRRSWRLTRRHGFRVFGMSVASVATLALVPSVVVDIATTAAASAVDVNDATTFAIGVCAGLLIASVPIALLLTLIGGTWCLLYYDLRAQAPAAGE